MFVLASVSSCGLNSNITSTTGKTTVNTTTVTINTTNSPPATASLTTTTTTVEQNTAVYTVITSTPISNQGSIQISDGTNLKTFHYAVSTTSDSFIFFDVTFTPWENKGITTPSVIQYGPPGGGYNITFKDGSTERKSTNWVTSPFGKPPTEFIHMTNHINPQAGLLINTTTGAVYFLVSQ